MAEKARKNHVGITPNSTVIQEPLADRIAHWVQDHGSTVLYVGVGVIVFLIALYAWSYRTAGDDEADYLKAAQSFRQFTSMSSDEKDPAQSPAFLELQAIITRHPELATRYDGQIAQTFIRLADMKMALQYGQRALKALSGENLPFYEDYSKTSLLMTDANYSEALKRAEFLGKKMNESKAQAGRSEQARGFGNVLYVSNLIRKAMLQQKLGNVEGELVAWQELQRLQNPQTGENAPAALADKEAFASVAAAFKTGKITLSDYIQAREKVLRR